jgi:hypothetical protein
MAAALAYDIARPTRPARPALRLVPAVAPSRDGRHRWRALALAAGIWCVLVWLSGGALDHIDEHRSVLDPAPTQPATP